MTKYVKSIKFSTSGETYVIRDAEQKSRLDTLEPVVEGKQDTLVSGENIKTINNQSILGSGNIEIGGGSGAVDSVNGKTGTVVLNASDVGAASETDLTTHTSNTTVHVTSAEKEEWSGKQDKLTSENAGDNVIISEVGGVVKISSTGGGSGSANWGSIGGTLSNQTDLKNALDAKLESGDLKTINNENLAGSGNIELLTSSDLDNYYTKQEADSEFLTSSDLNDYYTKTEADDEFVSSNDRNGFAGKILSVMGDSISTFTGWVPVADGHNLEHTCRYPQEGFVTEVEDMWWYRLFSELNMQLGVNDSWRGTTVSNTRDTNVGVYGPDAAMASMTRITNLGSKGTPDVIMFYGGTNDCGTGVTPGSFDSTQNYHTVDLTTYKWSTFADAYKCAIMRMQYFYPDAKIIAMLPTYCTTYYTMSNLDKYNEIIKEVCDYFGVPVIDLRQCGINWQSKDYTLADGIHPKPNGMDLIAKYLKTQLLSLFEMDSGVRELTTVSHNLTNVKGTKDWYQKTIIGKPYVEILSGASEIYTVNDSTVTVTMGGINVTSTAYNTSNKTISIDNVTGAISVTASGQEQGVTTVRIASTDVTTGIFKDDGTVLSDGTLSSDKRVVTTSPVSILDYPYVSIPEGIKWCILWCKPDGSSAVNNQTGAAPSAWTTTTGLLDVTTAAAFAYNNTTHATHYKLQLGRVDNVTLTAAQLDSTYNVSYAKTNSYTYTRINSTDVAEGIFRDTGVVDDSTSSYKTRVCATDAVSLADYPKVMVPSNMKYVVAWFKADGTTSAVNNPSGALPSGWTDGTGAPVDVTNVSAFAYNNTTDAVKYKIQLGLTSNSDLPPADLDTTYDVYYVSESNN